MVIGAKLKAMSPSERKSTVSSFVLDQKKWNILRDLLLLGWFIAEIFTFTYGVARSNSWILGEWMIDYSGGFTRRGLSGEIISSLSFGNWDLARTVTVVIYALLLACLIFVLRRDFLEFPVFSGIGLLLGPLALLAIFSDPNYGGRKDIILLLLAAISISRQTNAKQVSNSILMVFFFLWLAAGLTHEGLLFFSPGIAIALLWLGKFQGQKTRRIMLSFMPLIAAAVSALAILLAPPVALGSTCQSWIDSGAQTQFCDGAISWSSYGLEEGLSLVANAVNSDTYFLVYGSALALIFVFLSLLIRLDAIKLSGLLLLSFFLHLGSLVMLSIIAVDWGRWLHIGMVLATMTLVSAKRVSPSNSIAKKANLLHLLVFAFVFLLTGVSHTGADFTNPVIAVLQFISNRI